MTEELIARIGNLECLYRQLKDAGAGSGGITLPSGGSNGDVLAKSGSTLVWASPSSGGGFILTSNNITVTTNGQTEFENAFPEGMALFSLEVEGFPQILNVDYEVDGNDIIWISSDPAQLLAGFILTIVYY